MSEFSSQEPVVDVADATIFQDQQAVLSEVSFSLQKGEFVFLVGRTGSGKSSLMKTLYADLTLRLGDARVAGYNIRGIKASQVPLMRRKLGIVFQDFQLLMDRSVGDNLIFVMKATGWKDRSAMKARMSDVLIQVGLGNVASKMPHQLSGGEQQRVSIARALLNEPILFIADEPTGNLDPEVSEGIFKIFREINKSGTAVLMATHSYNFLKDNEYRILKCDRGKLLDSSLQNIDLNDLSAY